MDDANIVINEIFDYFGKFKRSIVVCHDGVYETETFEFNGLHNVYISIKGSVLVADIKQWPLGATMRVDLSDPDFDLASTRLRVLKEVIKLQARYDEWHFHDSQKTLGEYYRKLHNE